MKLSKKDIKANRGITLIALVITIIVLLILAGVAIATLTGDNGILTKTGDAKNTSQDAEIEEEIRVAWNKVYMDSYLDSSTDKAEALKAELEKNKPGETATVKANGSKLNVSYREKDKVLDVSTGTVKEPSAVAKAINEETVFRDDNTPMKDEYGNTFIIPKGFKLSKDSAEVVTEGIVIEDATYTNTKGSEFVWIPVGIPWKSDPSKTIKLSRYTFDGNGKPTDQGATTIDDYYTELASSTYKTAVAKNINDFILKTNSAGGFWIGRYEARVEGYTRVLTWNGIENPSWTGYVGGKLVEKPNAQVFNYITHNKSSELSRKMYTSDYFESDLINSYAWDTAVLFLQEYDNRTEAVKSNSNHKAKYSIQISLSSGLKNTGTNASDIAEANKDKICNVYDMADNCIEKVTETSSCSGCPCVERGGQCDSSNLYTGGRRNSDVSSSGPYGSFRPVLYIK